MIQEKITITFDNKKQVDDVIACITSTAEQIASFTARTSACSDKEQQKNNFIAKKIRKTRTAHMEMKGEQIKDRLLLHQQLEVGEC